MKIIKKFFVDLFFKIYYSKVYVKVLLVVGLAGFIYVASNITIWANSSKYKVADYKQYIGVKKELSSGTIISNDNSSDVVIEENNKYILGINPRSTNVYIISKDTGKRWNSTVVDDGSAPQMYGEEPKLSKSNVILYYAVKATDVVKLPLSSYEYSVEGQTYTLEKIQGGVRINYNLVQSTVTNKFFPSKLSYERYDELFTNNPLISASDKTFVSKSMYTNSQIDQCYVLKLNSTTNNYKRLYKIMYEVSGYSIDQLTVDNLEFDIETTAVEFPNFKVSLEFILTSKGLSVNVPTYAFEENETYRIDNVIILPYFGASEKGSDGYMVVPDGSGAIINYDKYTSSGFYYDKQVYDNDALYNTGFANSYSKTEDIALPIIGTINNTKDQGLMITIEEGGEMADFIASQAGYMNYQYNLIHTRIEHYIKDKIGLYNIYDSNTVTVVTEEPIYFDYKLNYFFLEGETNSYFGMAKLYQNYIIEKNGLIKNYSDSVKLNIEAIGYATIKRALFGFDYDKAISLTSTSELATIANEMKDSGVNNASFIYNGFVNKGVNQTSLVNLDFNKGFKKKDLQALEQEMSNLSFDFSYGVNMIKVYSNDNGYSKNKYSSRIMDNSVLTQKAYSLTTYKFDDSTSLYYLLSPKYIGNYLERTGVNFKKNSLNAMFTFNDLGSMYIADYKRGSEIDGLSSKALIIEALERNNTKANFKDPYDYVLKYANYISDVSYESSKLYCFDATIPLKQLVYNGLINYSTIDFNNNTYYFSKVNYLKAIETGSDLKYLITYQDASKLKNSEFNYLYATNYDSFKEEMVQYYKDYVNFVQEIGSREIINHEIIDDNIIKVTYRGNKSVVFNYSYKEYVYYGSVIPSESYLLV